MESCSIPSSLSLLFINVILSWYWWELFIPQTWFLLFPHYSQDTGTWVSAGFFLVIYELHSDHIFPTHFFLLVKCSLVFALRICYSLLVWLYYFWWMIKWTFRKLESEDLLLCFLEVNTPMHNMINFLPVWQHLQMIYWIHMKFCRLWINFTSCSDKINVLSH